jgi:hypothetical protein
MSADTDFITVQVDCRNAFKTLCCKAALTAFRSPPPPILLPFIQWTYRQHTSLFVQGASENSQPFLSRSCVQRGNPCGILVFCLALRTTLEQTQELHPAARVLAYVDDRYLQGGPEEVIAAFHTLRNLAAALDLKIKLHKYSYGRDGAAVAQEVGIGFAQNGFLACGTLLGAPSFVALFLERQVDQVNELADALLALPLATQDKYLLLPLSHGPKHARTEL